MNNLVKQLFDYETWELSDLLHAEQYFDCTLKKDIGKYCQGEIIDTIYINYESATMEFYDAGGEVIGKYNLTLGVKE